MDVRAIAASSTPVLCIDTCSILDMMRDPSRDTVRTEDRRTSIELLSMLERGELHCLAAEQVAIEFGDQRAMVETEARQGLERAIEQINRVNSVASVYGGATPLDLSHLLDHVARTSDIVDRWMVQTIPIVPGADVPSRAFARVNAARPPARRGKDSSKDCLIYETYLEVAEQIRAAGFAGRLVLLSSNTKEYLTEGRVLKGEIATEFSALGIQFAPNMSAAKHYLFQGSGGT